MRQMQIAFSKAMLPSNNRLYIFSSTDMKNVYTLFVSKWSKLYTIHDAQ